MSEERSKITVDWQAMTPAERADAIEGWRLLIRVLGEDAVARLKEKKPQSQHQTEREIRQQEFARDLTGAPRSWANVRWLLGQLEADEAALREELEECREQLEYLRLDQRRLARYLRRLQRQR